MPTYQYACTACGERSEAVQSFTDAPLTECTACGGTLRKVFSSVGVVFKGSGFYKTDSRKTPETGAKSGDGDKSGDGKNGESKPAAAKTDSPSTSGDKSAATSSTASSTSSGSSTSSSTPASKSA